MGNKILVEFDREFLKQKCKQNWEEYHWSCCKECNKTDEKIIYCLIPFEKGYKIKEQNNGKS